MTKTVVIYHSAYGHTKVVAEHVARGAGAGASLVGISPEGDITEADWAALNAADAIVFGTPTYMGNVSWQFKKFADASSKAWYSQAWKDKIFGGFTASANVNGDKHSTLHYFMTLAMQHGGIWVGTGLHYNNTKASQRSDVNYLASSAGPMAQTPGDAGGAEMNAGDLETARLFGQRVAEVAAKFRG